MHTSGHPGFRVALLTGIVSLLLWQQPGFSLGAVPESQPAGAGLKQQYQAGLAHFRAGRLKEALDSFKPVSAGASGYLKLCATNMVGQTCRLDGDLKGALEAFKSVSDQAGSIVRGKAGAEVTRRAELLRQLAIVYQAEILEEQGRWTRALEEYEVLLKEPSLAQNSTALVQNAASYERIARLYWRVGQHAKAVEALETLLKRWPDCPHAPLIAMSILVLKNNSEIGSSESRFGFLCMPLAGGLIPSAATGALALPPSSGLESPVLKAVRELLNRPGTPPEWAAYIRLHYAWILFQLDRLDEAEAEFQTAAAAGAGLQLRAFSPYCVLGTALVFHRRQRWEECISLAQDMAQAGEGHARAFAEQLLTASQRMQDESRKSKEEKEKAEQEAASRPS